MTPQLNAVVQVTCAHLQQLVYPLWDKYTPKIVEFDQRIGLSKSVQPAWDAAAAKWTAIDDAYSVSSHLQSASHVVQDAASKFASAARHAYKAISSFYFYNLHPSVCYYFEKYKLTLEYVGDNVLSGLRRHGWYAAKKLQISLKYVLFRYVLPYTHKAIEVTTHNQYVDQVCETLHLKWALSEIHRLYAKLKAKSVVINAAVLKKTEFLINEYGAAEKFDLFKKSIKQSTKKNILLILDITQELTGFSKQQPEVIDEGSESSDYSDEEDITITLTRTLTETISSTTSINTQEAFSSASEFDFDTVQQTNLTNIEQSSDVNVTDSNAVSFESESQAQVNYELGLWENQIQSTLDLAQESLESDFAPYLEKKLSELKELFSANFTTLQSDNYKRYKVMNELIAEIDKDSEFIRTHEQIIEEPKIDRQLMRDKIKEARDVVESQMDYADAELSKAHSDVLTAYFEVAQTTVDVLESFAETTILDFSLRLKSLIEYVKTNADYEDKISWEAWKRFHKIKESIFQIRDQIFDEAHAYKDDPQTVLKPKALAKWDEYLRNINFHIGFIVRDNDEYLRLVRAQANVAYQQREGLTYELEQKIEAEKRAAEESALEEKLEREAREAQELEAKRAKEQEEEIALRQENKLESEAKDLEEVDGFDQRATTELEEQASEKPTKEQSPKQVDSVLEKSQATVESAEADCTESVEKGTKTTKNTEFTHEPVELSSLQETLSVFSSTAETSLLYDNLSPSSVHLSSTSNSSISKSSTSLSTIISSVTELEKIPLTSLGTTSTIQTSIKVDNIEHVSEPSEADEDFEDENIEAL